MGGGKSGAQNKYKIDSQKVFTPVQNCIDQILLWLKPSSKQSHSRNSLSAWYPVWLKLHFRRCASHNGSRILMDGNSFPCILSQLKCVRLSFLAIHVVNLIHINIVDHQMTRELPWLFCST